jgi:DNA polymerase III gamma/tau subunit
MNDWHLKYRPDNFKSVLGQDMAIKSLQQVIKKKNAHSFIFTGPSGVGKTTLARIIAKAVDCEKNNILEADAATYTGIDAMRNIATSTQFSALGKTPIKVIIIDEAHALSKAAWQSLLKSVEEPPNHVYWIFCTTEGNKIPKTIQTRCLIYDLKSVNTNLLYDLLVKIAEEEKLDLDDDLIYYIAQKSEQSPRRAITNLALCVECKDKKEVSELLSLADESDDLLTLMRGLVENKLTWEKVIRLVKPLKDKNVEGIRRSIAGYLTAVLLNTKQAERAAGLLSVLDAFAKPYPNQSGLYPLLLSLGRVLFEEG